MLNQLRAAVLVLLALTLVTGVAYPLFITGVSKMLFPKAAAGSLVEHGDQIAGSRLIGQPFDEAKYFWSRPSAAGAVGYDGKASGASNLGPTNPALVEAVKTRIAALRAADPENTAPVPVDLVTASGSGLDPHISEAAAAFQAGRVARARNLDPAKVRAMIQQNTDGRDLGILGEPGVDVLALNLALDAASPSGQPQAEASTPRR